MTRQGLRKNKITNKKRSATGWGPDNSQLVHELKTEHPLMTMGEMVPEMMLLLLIFGKWQRASALLIS